MRSHPGDHAPAATATCCLPRSGAR
jgi:hypothetical protein